jgi:hypothetical protein
VAVKEKEGRFHMEHALFKTLMLPIEAQLVEKALPRFLKSG